MSGQAVETPQLIVISGPSGAGKTTVANRVLAYPRFDRAVTATTRAPRGDETHGVDYEFLSRADFEAGIGAGDFLESAVVYGELYGTPRKNVDRVLGSGRNCLLVVDVQGANTIRGLDVGETSVFVKAPSLDELEARLRSRGEDDETSIARRLDAAREELKEEDHFDVVIVNDQVEAAARRLAAHLGLELADPSETEGD